MDRITSATAVASLPAVPDLTGLTRGFFSEGNPSGGPSPTILPAWWVNMMQEELLAVLLEAGLTPDPENLGQLLEALNTLYGAGGGGNIRHGIDTGTVNTIVGTPTPAPAAFANGMAVAVRILVANTGATTINVNALGAKNVLNPDGTALMANQLAATGWALFIYSALADAFHLLTLPGPAFFASLASGSTAYHAVDSGSANTIVAAIAPAPGSLAAVRRIPLTIEVVAANTGATTLNLNGLGATAVVNLDGAPLISGQMQAGAQMFVYNGTNFTLLTTSGPKFDQSGAINYAVAGGTANAITVTLAPVPAALPAGFPLRFKATAANTGATTINVNGIGAWNIKSAAGNALVGGEFVVDGMYELLSTGTEFRLASVPSSGTAGGGGSGAGTGILKKRTFYTSGSGNFTPAAGTVSIVVRAVGGGGGGGSSQGGGDDVASGGGAAGSFIETAWLVSALSFPAAYAVGAGGAANSNANGSAGGTTTLGAFLTAPGGGGGSAGVSASSWERNAAGGTPGAVASATTSPAWTKATRGAPGLPGIAWTASAAGAGLAGAGGSGPWGGGGMPPAVDTPGVGGAGTGVGSGGAGSFSDGAGDYLAGAGAAGLLEIEEWGN